MHAIHIITKILSSEEKTYWSFDFVIDLEEGVRMMSHVEMDNPDDPVLRVGASVTAKFVQWSAEFSVPVFEIKE